VLLARDGVKDAKVVARGLMNQLALFCLTREEEEKRHTLSYLTAFLLVKRTPEVCESV